MKRQGRPGKDAPLCFGADHRALRTPGDGHRLRPDPAPYRVILHLPADVRDALFDRALDAGLNPSAFAERLLRERLGLPDHDPE